MRLGAEAEHKTASALPIKDGGVLDQAGQDARSGPIKQASGWSTDHAEVAGSSPVRQRTAIWPSPGISRGRPLPAGLSAEAFAPRTVVTAPLHGPCPD